MVIQSVMTMMKNQLCLKMNCTIIETLMITIIHLNQNLILKNYYEKPSHWKFQSSSKVRELTDVPDADTVYDSPTSTFDK